MAGGAPIGNKNAERAKVVYDMLKKAAASEDWKRLREGCEKVMDAFATADPWAVQFVADRLDGKAVQQITGDLNVTDSAQELNDDELLVRLAAIHVARTVGRSRGNAAGTVETASSTDESGQLH